MKKSLFLLFVLLVTGLSASAHDFVVDGIYYNINGSDAVVTYRGEYYYSYTNEYSGNVTIPATVSYNGTVYWVEGIGMSAFKECSALTSVTMPNSITYIDICAFESCTSLTNVIIPNSVGAIYTEAFATCTGLTSVKIPNSVEMFSSGVFAECSNLKSVTIPNTVEAIDAGLFAKCTSLTTVTIGSSVEYIDEYAFNACTSLNSVKVMATTPPYVDSYAFNSNHYSNVSIKVPKGCMAAYQSSESWRNFTNISEFVSLNDALNIGSGNIQFMLSGDYSWFTESEGGRDYAKSGNDGAHNSTSVLTATVTVNEASTLSFDFKAWGEGSGYSAYDKCIFTIDGSQKFSYGARQNDWETYTVDIPAGTHTLTWTYEKDGSVNPSGDYFAVDNVSVMKRLDPVLNVTGGTIHFTSGGAYPWTVIEDGGRNYAKSGNAGVPSSTSVMTATVSVDKASTLSFDFKAWGEGTSYDVCIFSIDGVQQFKYGARQNDWETYMVDIPAGTHTLTWTYQKDASVNPTGDYFAIDNVALRKTLDLALNVTGGTIHFTSEGAYPWIVMEEGGRDYAKSSNSGVASSSSMMTATVAIDKASTLSFDFKAWGEGTSYDVCIFSIDGVQQFKYGARQNDWETFTVDISAGTHTLTWTYQKDSSVNPTGDYFAVDNVKFTVITIQHGDVDGNGQIDMDDLTALINYLLTGNASYVNMTGADVNGSGSVNMDDLTAMINRLLNN